MENNRRNQQTNSGIIPQVLFGLALVVALYLALLFVQIMYTYINRLSLNRTILLADTYNIQDKTITISQNPNVQGSIPITLSNNEPSGIEFTYSFYLNISPTSFNSANPTAGLLHIFHKGYPSQFPLLAPGVYMHSNTNKLRIYMNTYKTWNNYVDIENIPIGKWVHIALVCENDALLVFINGNIANKMSFNGYVPYQNYEDIICFSQRIVSLNQSTVPSVDPSNAVPSGFIVYGAASGQLSRLTYFSYALCYAEIQQLMNKGPSSKLASTQTTGNMPPYLDDTWWNNGY
jgi:hypothetical protein